MAKPALCVALLCCSCALLSAEQVTLKNGDRLTGSIVSVSEKKLTIKTEYAGAVTVDWAAVADFTTAAPMFVTRTNDQVLSGTLSTKESTVVVNTPAGPQQIPMSDIAVI